MENNSGGFYEQQIFDTFLERPQKILLNFQAYRNNCNSNMHATGLKTFQYQYCQYRAPALARFLTYAHKCWQRVSSFDLRKILRDVNSLDTISGKHNIHEDQLKAPSAAPDMLSPASFFCLYKTSQRMVPCLRNLTCTDTKQITHCGQLFCPQF